MIENRDTDMECVWCYMVHEHGPLDLQETGYKE